MFMRLSEGRFLGEGNKNAQYRLNLVLGFSPVLWICVP